MNASNLTRGALVQLLDWTPERFANYSFVVQVGESKSQQGKVKLTIYDGVHKLAAVLSVQAQNSTQGNLTNSVIRITSFTLNTVTTKGSDKRLLLLMILNLQVLGQAAEPVPPDAAWLKEAVAHYSAAVERIANQQQSAVNPYGGGAYGPPQMQQQVQQPMQQYQPQAHGQHMQQPLGYQQPHGLQQPMQQPMQAYQQQQPLQAYQQQAPPAAYGAPAGFNATQASSSAARAAGGRAQPAALRPQYGSAGATARNTNDVQITPISKISPFMSRWTIRGRCTSKSEKRTWNKSGKTGCVFNFDLFDGSAEIRCVAFNDEADRFYDRVESGQWYEVSKANAKMIDAAKRKWNQTKHDCEVYMERDSKLERCDEGGSGNVPRVRLDRKQISAIQSMDAGTFVDIVGVVESCDDTTEITRRDGSSATKRSLCVRDESNMSIEVTLWGEKVNDPGRDIYDRTREGGSIVLAARGCKIGDFNGKNLSVGGGSMLLLDPEDLPEFSTVRQWYDQGGAAQPAQRLSVPGKGGRADRRVTIGTILDERLGNEQPAWVKVIAVLMSVRQKPMTYPACSADFNGRLCQKKMQPAGDGTGNYHCERCGVTGMPTYRYCLDIGLMDLDGHLARVSAFGDIGVAVLGMTAEEAQPLEDEENKGFEELLARVMHKPKAIKLKCAEDNYNNEKTIKYSFVACEDMNFVEESKALLSMIDDLCAGRPVKLMQPPEPRGAAVGGGFGGAASPGAYGAQLPGGGAYGSPGMPMQNAAYLGAAGLGMHAQGMMQVGGQQYGGQVVPGMGAMQGMAAPGMGGQGMGMYNGMPYGGGNFTSQAPQNLTFLDQPTFRGHQ